MLLALESFNARRCTPLVGQVSPFWPSFSCWYLFWVVRTCSDSSRFGEVWGLGIQAGFECLGVLGWGSGAGRGVLWGQGGLGVCCNLLAKQIKIEIDWGDLLLPSLIARSWSEADYKRVVEMRCLPEWQHAGKRSCRHAQSGLAACCCRWAELWIAHEKGASVVKRESQKMPAPIKIELALPPKTPKYMIWKQDSLGFHNHGSTKKNQHEHNASEADNAMRKRYKLDLPKRKHLSKFCFRVFVAANFLAHCLCNLHLGFGGDRQTGPLTRTYRISIAISVLSTWANLSQIEYMKRLDLELTPQIKVCGGKVSIS